MDESGDAAYREERVMARTAECHCGQLKAIASGEPASVYVCHCKACQRRTGLIGLALAIGKLL
jgi:hypothetical protein